MDLSDFMLVFLLKYIRRFSTRLFYLLFMKKFLSFRSS